MPRIIKRALAEQDLIETRVRRRFQRVEDTANMMYTNPTGSLAMRL